MPLIRSIVPLNGKHFSALFILSLFCSPLFAQRHFEEGTVTGPDNRSFTCQIDFAEWGFSPVRIDVKDPATGRLTAYTAADIRSFRVHDETYESHTVKIYPYSPEQATVISENFNMAAYEKRVFLRLVTAGKINLYAYRDSLNIPYFFIQKDTGAVIQLRLNTRLAESSSGQQSVEYDEIYKRQLPVYLADCNRLTGSLTRLSYSEAVFRKLIFSYNNCSKDTIDQGSVKKGRRLVEFFPVLGFSSSKVIFSGGADASAKLSFPSSGSVVLGAGLSLTLPRQHQKFSFVTDLLYRHIQSGGNSYMPYNYLTQTATLDFGTIRWDVLFRYTYPDGLVRPFAELGLSNSFVTSNKSWRQSYDSRDGSTTQAPFFGQGNSFRTHETGALAGIGVRIKAHLSLEARFELTNGLSPFEFESSQVSSFYLLAAWYF